MAIAGRDVTACGFKHGIAQHLLAFGAGIRESCWKLSVEVGCEAGPIGTTKVCERLPATDGGRRRRKMMRITEREKNWQMIRVERRCGEVAVDRNRNRPIEVWREMRRDDGDVWRSGVSGRRDTCRGVGVDDGKVGSIDGVDEEFSTGVV